MNNRTRGLLAALLLALCCAAPGLGQSGGVAGFTSRAFGAANWRKPVASVTDLPLTGNQPGDTIRALDTLIVYVWNGFMWVDDASQGPPGAPGEQGPPGEPGVDGVDGDPGAAATVAVGAVTTGAPGSSATVVNSGSSQAAVLDFAIPRGATGSAGAAGVDGQDGADGATGATGPMGATGATGA